METPNIKTRVAVIKPPADGLIARAPDFLVAVAEAALLDALEVEEDVDEEEVAELLAEVVVEDDVAAVLLL